MLYIGRLRGNKLRVLTPGNVIGWYNYLMDESNKSVRAFEYTFGNLVGLSESLMDRAV